MFGKMQRKEIRLQYDFKELGSKHTIYFLLSIEITQLELSLFHFCDKTIHINIAIVRKFAYHRYHKFLK